MKKQFLFAVAATMLTACVNTDTLRDYNVPQGSENDGSILFTSFTDKVTKGPAENSDASYTWTFFDHQESFMVWGRKAGQATHEIFGGTTVTVAHVTTPNEGYTYTYSPARFWDKNATKYHFYAAAPADNSWTFNGGSIQDDNTLDKGYFTTSATLNGVNLKHKDNLTNNNTRASLYDKFKGIPTSNAANAPTDIDKLIAAPCDVLNTYYNKAVPNAVNLNFIHILSKLNVTISTSLFVANHTYDVDLLAFEIYNIPNAGNFNESTAIPNDKKIIRWTRDGTTTTSILTGIDNTNKVDVASPTAANETGDKAYIVESLIMPQSIAYERVALDGKNHDAISGVDAYTAVSGSSQPYFRISYSIDGDVFTQYYNLAAAFLGYTNNSQKNSNGDYINLTDGDATTFPFYEGWQNTLNIIINPAAITFTADVATWSTEQNYNYEIEKGNQ